MKTLISIMLILLFSSSKCKRNDEPTYDGNTCSGNCFILTGQIVDTPATNKLADVELKFYYTNQGKGSLMWSIPIYLGVTKTNSNGEYRFSFDGTKFTDPKMSDLFYIIYNKPGYFYDDPEESLTNYFSLKPSDINVPLVQNYTFFKKATLKVHFKSQQSLPYDRFYFLYDFGKINGGATIPGYRPVDTTITFTTAGDVRTTMNWGPDYKGGAGHFEIVVPANSEKLYTVNP